MITAFLIRENIVSAFEAREKRIAEQLGKKTVYRLLTVLLDKKKKTTKKCDKITLLHQRNYKNAHSRFQAFL